LKSLNVIERVARKSAPGRSPYFVEAHLVKALIMIDAEGPAGRVKLARTLGLGEGSARTLIKHLEKEGLIVTSRKGIVLSGVGERLVCSLKTNISQPVEIPRSSLTVGAFNIAVLVRRAADVIRAGLEQRDAAIKVGALGATTLMLSGGRLTMPSVDEDVFRDSPGIREIIVSQLKPQEKDVILIGSANDRLTAEFGAIAAALETLKTRGSKA